MIAGILPWETAAMKACLNGGRTRGEHPAVPITPAELARSARDAFAAGAGALHLHPRDPAGAESLRADDIADAVAAVRHACPAAAIGVSTGLWIAAGDPEARLAQVRTWASLPAGARPDFASVNLSEPGSAVLVAALTGAGIAVEAGVWSVADVAVAADTPSGGWLRVLVEIIGVPAYAAVGTADTIIAALDAAGVAAPRLLHGEQAACWPVLAHAGQLGLASRIGLEDTTVGPSGEAVRDNADLMRLGLETWHAAREHASP